MPQHGDRLPPVPSTFGRDPQATWNYMASVVRILNGEAYISKFSGTNPNTSGVTGKPGDLLVNIGSASTSTRLWVKKGAGDSQSTISWVPVRIA